MVSLDSKILLWINEERESSLAQGKHSAAPLRILMLRLAADQGPKEIDVSTSTELSLQVYQKASFYRTIRSLQRKGLIEVITAKGRIIPDLMLHQKNAPPEQNLTQQLFTRLTTQGVFTVGNIQRCHLSNTDTEFKQS